MKESVRDFIRKVVFTTTLSFTLITFFYLIINAWVIWEKAAFDHHAFSNYMLGKLFCIFLFSLCLGFANRIPERKKGNRAVLHLTRFFVTLAAFSLTLILLFYSIFEGMDQLTVQGALLNLTLFLIFYFATLGVTALGRKIFLKEKTEPYKSILD